MDVLKRKKKWGRSSVRLIAYGINLYVCKGNIALCTPKSFFACNHHHPPPPTLRSIQTVPSLHRRSQRPTTTISSSILLTQHQVFCPDRGFMRRSQIQISSQENLTHRNPLFCSVRNSRVFAHGLFYWHLSTFSPSFPTLILLQQRFGWTVLNPCLCNMAGVVNIRRDVDDKFYRYRYVLRDF